MAHLIEQYKKHSIPALQKEFKIGNVMATPKLLKVVINVGVGKFFKEDKILERVSHDVAMLSGQKPTYRLAKKSIASFKVREGVPVGIAVTLRGKRMYDFADRFVNIALPRSKDFRGLPESNVDANGNLNVGLRESSIFPELNYENVKDIFSMQVTFATSAKSRAQGVALLKSLGFPIKSE